MSAAGVLALLHGVGEILHSGWDELVGGSDVVWAVSTLAELETALLAGDRSRALRLVNRLGHIAEGVHREDAYGVVDPVDECAVCSDYAPTHRDCGRRHQPATPCPGGDPIDPARRGVETC